MNALLDQLTVSAEEAKAKQAIAVKACLRLARRLADGADDPELADVQETLAAAGWDLEKLKSATYTQTRRNSNRAAVKQAEDAVHERITLREQIAAAIAVLQEAQRVHDATVRPLHGRLRELSDVEMEAFQARRNLQDEKTCPDRSLIERLQEVRCRARSLISQVSEKSAAVSQIEDALRREKKSRTPARQDEWRNEREGYDGGDPRRIAALESRLAASRAELAPLLADIAALSAEETQLMTGMLDA
jgi:hypothetical protein